MAQGGEEKKDEKERLSIKFIEHLSQRHKDEEGEGDEDCMILTPSHHWNFIKAVNFKTDRGKIQDVQSSFTSAKNPTLKNTPNNRSSRKDKSVTCVDGTTVHHYINIYLKKRSCKGTVLKPDVEKKIKELVEPIEKSFGFKFIDSELRIRGYASRQQTQAICWNGIIDVIGVMEDGTIIVIDWKLTSDVLINVWKHANGFSPKLHQLMIYRELIIAAARDFYKEKAVPVVGILLAPISSISITASESRLCLCFKKLQSAGFFEKINEYAWTAQKPRRGDEHKVKAVDSGDILIQGQKQVEGMTEDQLRDSTKHLLSSLGTYWQSLCDKDRQGLSEILKSWETSMGSKDASVAKDDSPKPQSVPKTPSIIKEESTVKKGKEGEYRGTGARPKVRRNSFNEKDKQEKKEKGTLNSKRESTSNDKPKTAPIIKEESKVEAGGAGCSCHGAKKCAQRQGDRKCNCKAAMKKCSDNCDCDKMCKNR